MKRTTTMSGLLTMTLGAIGLAGCGGHSHPETDSRAASAPVVTAPPSVPAIASVAPAPSVAPVAAIAPLKGVEAPAAKPRKTKSSGELHVRRLVLADGVANREPTDPESSFDGKTQDRIYAFVELENPSQEKGQIVIEFDPPGGGPPRGLVKLDVGASPRWRTWAFTREARTAGEWTLVVKSEDGKVLAKTPFTVTS